MNLSKEYDLLYQEASDFLKKHNPCRREGGYYVGYPIGYSIVDDRKYLLCCSGCKHHSKRIGCRVKSLVCKLWLCSTAKGNLTPEQRQEWDEMNNRFKRIFGHHGIRQSKSYFMREKNVSGWRWIR